MNGATSMHRDAAGQTKMVTTTFAFVPSDNHGRPRASQRQFIRSRCMIGKYQRIGTRSPVRDKSLVRQDGPQATTAVSPKRRRLSSSVGYSSEAFCGITREEESLRETILNTPPPTPTDLSLVRFADKIDSRSQELIFKCV